VLLVAYVLIGSGVGLLNTPVTSSAVAALPEERAGVAGAVTSTFRQVGNSFGVAVLGTLTFSGFVSALPVHINALHLPAGAGQQAIDAARRASASGGLLSLHGVSPAVTGAVGAAFTAGLRVAYLVAAGFGVVALVVGLVAFRRHPATETGAG
jgi:hypothetical protein